MQIDIIVIGIGAALLFDFINGFHDSANAIATVVATRVLNPLQAVLMAGLFNFVGPFVFSLAIADQVAKTVNKAFVTPELVLGALTGAIAWNLLTWWLGLPSSSSHALTGGLIGAALAHGGIDAVAWPSSSEFLSVARYLGYGAVGGLAAGLFAIGWSRLRLPRASLPAFVIAGAVGLGYFSTQEIAYPAVSVTSLETVRSFAKPLLLQGVYVVFGAIMGIFVWAGSQQPMRAKTALYFALPGAFATVGVAVLLKWFTLNAVGKTVVFMVISPFLAFFMGFVMYTVLQWAWRDQLVSQVQSRSRKMQIGSSAFYALTHGTNDAQKTMGVIGLLLIAGGYMADPGKGVMDIPSWVILSSAGAMGLGTAFGGWRIVKTMASRITHLTPPQGFAAETGGGVVLVGMAESGIPVSTTHAISGAIMGVGATRRASAVRWGVGRQMFIAWVLTIPASAIVAALTTVLVKAVI